MLEGNTLLEVLIFMLGAGGGLAILLQRIPGWDALDSRIKLAIVAVVNVASPMVLILLKAYTPPNYLEQTPAQIALGFATLAVSFVIHQIDEWLAAKTLEAKFNAQFAARNLNQ